MPIAFGGSLPSVTHGSAGQSHQRRPRTRPDWAEGVRVCGGLGTTVCCSLSSWVGAGLCNPGHPGIQADPHHSVLPQRAGIRAPQEGLDTPKCGLTLRFYQRPSSPQDQDQGAGVRGLPLVVAQGTCGPAPGTEGARPFVLSLPYFSPQGLDDA